MSVAKFLMQRKAPYRVLWLRHFSLGDFRAFLKVTFSGQKLNYKDHISATPLQLPARLFGRQPACASCPAHAPRQRHCMQQQRVCQAEAGCGHSRSAHAGAVWSTLPATSAALTHKLWQARKRSSMQYQQWGDPRHPACCGGSKVQPPLSFSYPANSYFLGLYLHLFHRRCDCNLGCKPCTANAC